MRHAVSAAETAGMPRLQQMRLQREHAFIAAIALQARQQFRQLTIAFTGDRHRRLLLADRREMASLMCM